MRHIHTSIVSRHLATRGNNKILRTPLPHTSSSEERLPASLVAPLPNPEQTNLLSSNHTYTKSTPKHIHHHYAPSVTSTHTTHIISSTAPTYAPHIIETIIAGIRYDNVQRELLTKPKTLTLQDAVQLCRSYEVSIIQLRELKGVQHKHSTHTDQFVDAIKTIRTPCLYCGRTHTRHEVCPQGVHSAIFFGKQNH